MANQYEFFKTPVKLTGRHARMAKELWHKEKIEDGYFKRLIDLYKIAPIVGFLNERRSKRENFGEDTATIYLEQITREKEELDFILLMLLMLEYSESGLYKQEEAVKKAFRGPETEEEAREAEELFASYVRGGIEVLYEALIVKQLSHENSYSTHAQTGALMEFLNQNGLHEKI